MCNVTIAAEITIDLLRAPSFTSGWSNHTASSQSYWNKTGRGKVGMFQVIMTGWPQHGQETISSNALFFVSWISRAMDWGQHNWVWDKAPVSWLRLSKLHQDLNPHLIFIFRPGYGILSRYWNSYFTRTMVRHPHHDNIKWVGLGQWILVLYYLSRTLHYPHPVQSLGQATNWIYFIPLIFHIYDRY